MTEPAQHLKDLFEQLGVEFDPPTGVFGARKLDWDEVDTVTLRHVRQIMGSDAPEELLDELRRRGSADAA
jgi:hypothetical protein